ncbi:DUF3888 domain-containing protein [Viridibacillus soli]|nr:DUF3888 domain-containing protein [Viridibacillus soli]
MLKKLILFFLLFLCISTTLNMKSYSSINENDGEIQELLIEEAFLRSMSGEISKAIKDYHGEIRLYFLPKITMVTKNEAEDNFDVTVQVVTYLRAIMPPYGIETITFRIPGYKVLKFEHKEIRGEDLPKDKFDSKSKIKKW